MEKQKIKFRDLSGGLKTAIVFLWIVCGIYFVSFFVTAMAILLTSLR